MDGAIHRAAGPELLKFCKAVPEVSPGVRCPTGKACVTPGAMLPARHVIHSVGPVYKNAQTSAPLLESTYASCLDAAKKNNFTKIAFPAISCGVYGYPLGEAAEVSACAGCLVHSTHETHAFSLTVSSSHSQIAVRTCVKSGGTLKEIHFYLMSDEAIRAWQHAAESELQPAD